MPLDRRGVLRLGAVAALGAPATGVREQGAAVAVASGRAGDGGSAMADIFTTLFLCGDVMLGRGIDQILPHPGDPRLREPYVGSALTYIALAERAHGPIPRAADPAYVWGDALDVLHEARPDARIVNLETSVTTSDAFWPKGINYRMHPANAPVLTAAGIDGCALANNHVLDFGRTGLLETLATLERLGVRTAGAGRDATAAAEPAALVVPGKGRVLVFAFGSTTSGIPREWAAGPGEPGVNLLPDLSRATVARIAARARAARRPGDLLVGSVHWGGNWGYDVPAAQRRFARALIAEAGFDAVHGHSSHHPKGIEVHRGRPILYGCGDFLNDYEGIGGYEAFRGDLALMYLPRFAVPGGELVEFRLVPFRTRRFRLERAPRADALWLRGVLDRESRRFGSRIELDDPEGTLAVVWR